MYIREQRISSLPCEYTYALQHTATHCTALQRTATHHNTYTYGNNALPPLRVNTCMHCNALQRPATSCNALQHTATHCNALQHLYIREQRIFSPTCEYMYAHPRNIMSFHLTPSRIQTCIFELLSVLELLTQFYACWV